MVPEWESPSSARGTAPRTRGKQSQGRRVHWWTVQLLPAPAGMGPPVTPSPPPAPRTRGDGPGLRAWIRGIQSCSSHPRGWSPLLAGLVDLLVLLPAPPPRAAPLLPRPPLAAHNP